MRDYLIIVILSVLFGFVLAYLFFQKNLIQRAEEGFTQKADTIVKIVPSEPLIIERVKTKIIYTGDTIVQTKPFVAMVDTVVKQDTIFAKYEFPENLFSLNLRRSDDTVRTVMIKTEIMKSESKNWWKSPAVAVAGLVVGYLLRNYIR
jgi:hypothetical protein